MDIEHIGNNWRIVLEQAHNSEAMETACSMRSVRRKL
jgi:hypothetical protein